MVPNPARPPRVGLIASANRPTDGAASPERTDNDQGTKWWKDGFGYKPEACASSGVSDKCEIGTLDADSGADEVNFEPYLVWAGYECSTFGFNLDDYRGRAERALLACQGAQVENELWSGDLARTDEVFDDNRYLSSEDSDVVTAGAETAANALALLEQALACNCGQQGMIHATRGVASLWHQGGALRREGNLLLTVNDTIVVPGAGYDGSGPYGPAADGSVWAYATGIVDVRLAPMQVIPENVANARDRATNTITIYAQRAAAATFDGCCHFAAEIDAPMPNIAGS